MTQQPRRLVTTPLLFQIDPIFTLDGFTPRQISSSPSPNTKLVLHGTNFMDYPTNELLCRVGDVVSEALYLTSNTVVCLLNGQPQSPGIVSVSLTLNGQDWTSCTGANPYLIVQTDAITLLSVTPLLGTSYGYTPITITVAGNGVVTSEHMYMCVINGISVLASQAIDTPQGEQQVTCVTPPYMGQGMLSDTKGMVQISLEYPFVLLLPPSHRYQHILSSRSCQWRYPCHIHPLLGHCTNAGLFGDDDGRDGE